MAAPRSAYLVHMTDGSSPQLVLAEADARTYPGRSGHQLVGVIRGDVAGTYYRLDQQIHRTPESPPLVFDQAAADARRALRVSGRAKLTAEERAALGDSETE